MSGFCSAEIEAVEEFGEGIQLASVILEDGRTGKALSFERFTGPLSPGDEVVINTIALDLALGSGGYHFVLWNLGRKSLDATGEGHIMKLRYTPLQFNVRAVEEELDPLETGELGSVLDGIPVISGSLHSQLLAAVLAYRDARPDAVLVYVMTDGGSLPSSFSKTVAFLKEKRLIDSVITCGHAFGGDLEAVNIFGALTAARLVRRADAVIALMGPGIVGTGSAVGFSGMEQAQIADAASMLGGRAIIIPRITFADPRERHRGFSHHSLSVLRLVACRPALVPLPVMEPEKATVVREQIERAGLGEVHRFHELDAVGALDLLERSGFEVTVMGRGLRDDPEFFMAAGAAGLFAARMGG
jgi:hypothetical protein